jgi:hypothetical protein
MRVRLRVEKCATGHGHENTPATGFTAEDIYISSEGHSECPICAGLRIKPRSTGQMARLMRPENDEPTPDLARAAECSKPRSGPHLLSSGTQTAQVRYLWFR